VKIAEVTTMSCTMYVTDDEQCTDANFGCSHYCVQTPYGAACFCPPGMQLNGSKTCVGQQSN